MAQAIGQDVVKEAQSMVAPSSIGDSASHSSTATGLTGHSDLSDHPNLDSNADSIPPPDHIPERDFAKSPLSALQAEASGGSDTDTSKPDSRKENNGHARSNSVKKPQSFKSVSVTKNFLAKTASTTPIISRTTEKIIPGPVTPTTASSPKPRLVAKSALGGLGARSGIPGAIGAVGGPDASKVWNRNKPVVPPVSKTFTDEELKQQYGIHMASRLTADEGSKESKWADIDDDEDDWAPEPVQWLDDNKSPPLEPPTLPPPPQPQALVPEAIVGAAPTATPVALNSKTILRPGSHNVQNKNLRPTNSTEKPPAKPTSPAPLPSKSPWQTLPPVDKASPVAFVAQEQQQQQQQQQQHQQHQRIEPQSPIEHYHPNHAKEIAADDFNRDWDGHARGHRTLFNSQSGLMESVDNRQNKGHPPAPMRQDANSRQPAVLQRPNQVGPPPPKFAGTEPWQPRHRAGSTSSAGRRLSFGPTDSSGPPSATLKDGSRPWTRASPSMSNAQVVVDEGEAAEEGGADAVLRQQQLMREKIERAKQQKQKQLEQEAREVEARKERLKAKMEALAAAAPTPSPTESREDGQVVKPLVTSPPKPPVPRFEGEVAQYGMIKVHQPQPVKKANMQFSQQPPSAPQQQQQQQQSQVQKPETKTTDQNPWRPAQLSDNLISGWSTSTPGNVWGPPTSARPLGNGTFDSNSSGFRAAPGSMRSSSGTNSGPGPIAPPSATGNSSQANQQTPATSSSQQTAGTNQSQYNHPEYSSQESKEMHGGPVNGYQAPQARYTHADWQSLPNKLMLEDDKTSQAAFMARARQHHGINAPQQPQSGSNMAIFRETFIRTAPSSVLGGAPTVISTEQMVNAPSAASKNEEENKSVNGLRPSRFFPANNASAQELEMSDSPPPPEISSLDTGVSKSSVKVHLPKIARVRLPPASTSPSASGAAPVKSAAETASWQSRIDSLLRPGAKPARSVVDASSRLPFEVSTSKQLTTVSLPVGPPSPLPRMKLVPLAIQHHSRDMDEDLFDQPEFGSTPTIRFPIADYTAFLKRPAASTAPYQAMNRLREHERDLSISQAEFDVTDLSEGKAEIIIRLFGQELPRTMSVSSAVIPTRRAFSTSGPYRGNSSHHHLNHHNNGHHNNGNTKPSGTYNRERRGGFHRGGGNNSSTRGRRNVSTPASVQ